MKNIQNIKKVNNMDTDIEFNDGVDEQNFLLDVLMNQVDIIYYINEAELGSIYDKVEEDKIKCISDAFTTMELAQKALRKKIKNFT